MEKPRKESSQLIEIVGPREISSVRKLNFCALGDTGHAEDHKWYAWSGPSK